MLSFCSAYGVWTDSMGEVEKTVGQEFEAFGLKVSLAF